MKLDTEAEYIAEKQKFDEYYARVLIPALQPLENRRKKYLKSFFAICLMIIIWIAWLVYAYTNKLEHNSQYDVLMCLIVLIVCMPMFMYYKKSKESILPILIKYFGDFKYIYHPQIQRNLLDETEIIDREKKLYFEEEFEGEYNRIKTAITKYCILKQYQSPDLKRKYVKKQGYGIIFAAEMKKNFKSKTIVVSDRGFMNRLLKYKGLRRVALESPEFEKIYEVFSDDQIEARYILTAVMLEYMVELEALFSKVEYSFINNQIWINISINKNYFECTSFFSTIANKKRFEKIFKQFYLLFSIIKILHLDQDRLL